VWGRLGATRDTDLKYDARRRGSVGPGMAKTTQTQSGSEPMTLGNMRHLGVHNLVASCLNEAAAIKV
jgi:hypothetical protein